MRKRTVSTHRAAGRITMPDEIDLSSYDSLEVAFTNRKGTELLNIQFRRESEGSVQFAINIIGPTGEVSTAMTLFDLPV